MRCRSTRQKIRRSSQGNRPSRRKKARLEILDIMDATLSEARTTISAYAPRLFKLSIPTDKIRDLIGPGGKKIKSIIEATGVKIDVHEDGTVHIFATSGSGGDAALQMVRDVTAIFNTFKVDRAPIHGGQGTAFALQVKDQAGEQQTGVLTQEQVRFAGAVVGTQAPASFAPDPDRAHDLNRRVFDIAGTSGVGLAQLP